MANTPQDKKLDEAINRLKERVAQEVEQHKDEEVNLADMEGVSGGWTIIWKTATGEA